MHKVCNPFKTLLTLS